MLFPNKRAREIGRLSLYLCFLYASVGPSSCSEMALVGGGRMVPLCLPYRYNPAGSTVFIFYSVLFPLSMCRCAMAWPFIHAQSRTIWLHKSTRNMFKIGGWKRGGKEWCKRALSILFYWWCWYFHVIFSVERPSGGYRFILPHFSVCLIICHSRLSRLFVVATAICHGTGTLASFVEWRKGITVRRELNGGE